MKTTQEDDIDPKAYALHVVTRKSLRTAAMKEMRKARAAEIRRLRRDMAEAVRHDLALGRIERTDAVFDQIEPGPWGSPGSKLTMHQCIKLMRWFVRRYGSCLWPIRRPINANDGEPQDGEPEER